MSHPPQIVLLTSDAHERERLSSALAGSRAIVRTPIGNAAAALPDVLVVTAQAATLSLGAHAEAVSRGEIGLVAIGGEIPADVSLPADYTARELRLACLLLTEIVRLRRERNRNKQAHRALSRLASSDPLTGLANRRAWDEQYRRRLAGDEPFCLVLLDLDQFKSINDHLGHAAGDKCLREAAQRLTAAVRQGDFLARYGGDEFALLLANLPVTQAAAVVERIRRSIADPSKQLDGETLSASAGWACFNPQEPAARNGSELFHRADEALRAAKMAGRNRTFPVPAEG